MEKETSPYIRINTELCPLWSNFIYSIQSRFEFRFHSTELPIFVLASMDSLTYRRSEKTNCSRQFANSGDFREGFDEFRLLFGEIRQRLGAAGVHKKKSPNALECRMSFYDGTISDIIEILAKNEGPAEFASFINTSSCLPSSDTACRNVR